MPYTIDWKPGGAIKRFSGKVTFHDVLQSEQEISGSPQYTALRYVLSDYTGTDYQGITDSQKVDINALRIGGFMVNPRIKYAFVLQNPAVCTQLKEAVAEAVMLHETRTFDTYAQAAQWLGLPVSA
jgi:hypothetical protein